MFTNQYTPLNIYTLEHHGCDSWEDMFRDYDEHYIQEKASGVEEAINNITENINAHKSINQDK